MRIRPIHFVPNVAEAQRFYQALGLTPKVHSRSGHWTELTAAGGELGLHDAAAAADGQGRSGVALNFVADEPLEPVQERLRAAGFPPEGTIVDQEWGRSLLVPAPDGSRTRRPPPRFERTKHGWRRRASDARRNQPRARGLEHHQTCAASQWRPPSGSRSAGPSLGSWPFLIWARTNHAWPFGSKQIIEEFLDAQEQADEPEPGAAAGLEAAPQR